MKQLIMTLFYLGFNFIWIPVIKAQEIKITYDAVALEVHHDNDITKSIMTEMAQKCNMALENMDFYAVADSNAYKFTHSEILASDYDGDGWLQVAISLALDGKYIFGNQEEKTAYYYPLLGDKIRRVSMNNVVWKITEERKEILGYSCFKATAQILDPEQEDKLTPPLNAWFSPSLSYTCGPTAYATLPGAILQLESSKIKFTAKQIDITKKGKIRIPNFQSKDILPHKEWNAFFSKNNPLERLRN